MANRWTDVAEGELATPAALNDRFNALRKGDVFNVKAYGAVGDGATDDTVAIQAAVTAAASGGVVFFPPATYLTTSLVTIGTNDVVLRGSCLQASTIKFAPTASGAVFSFTRSAEAIWHCGVEDLYFTSTDTTYQKTMVKATDARHFFVRKIGSIDDTWEGQTSIGIDVYGSEQIRIKDCYLYADQPVRFNVNPNLSTNSLDHSAIQRCNFVVSAGAQNYAVLFNTGTIVSQFEMSKVACVRGKGIVSKLSTGAVADKTLRFRNIRHEQGVGTDYAMAFAATVSETQNLSISDIDTGGETLGVTLGGCRNVTLTNLFLSRSSGAAVNFSSTCNAVTLKNVFYEAGSTIVGTYQVVGLEFLNCQNGASDNPDEAPLAMANGNNNDLALTAHHHTYSVTGPSGAFAITGLAEPSPGGSRTGRFARIVNNTAQIMTIAHENLSSTATNRIKIGGSGDLAISANGAVELAYVSASSRWFVVGYKA